MFDIVRSSFDPTSQPTYSQIDLDQDVQKITFQTLRRSQTHTPIKSELIGPHPPNPSAKKPAGSPKKPSTGGATNSSMAAEIVKHAITMIGPDELRMVADKVGADPIKLRDVSWALLGKMPRRLVFQPRFCLTDEPALLLIVLA
jgi:hypothetical protein